jgi:hypothetical protein
MVKFHPVKLVGLNDRAKKIIAHYNNALLLEEYDEYGRPLNMKDGEPAIFCASPDMFWHGWFVLDKDVRFMEEVKNLSKSIEQNKKSPPVL